MTAARTGDTATLDALIAHGARVNDAEKWKGQTALMWAAHENNAPAIKTLLAAGAERDVRSTAGDFSALLFAVRAGSVDATRALLEAGADANETLLDGTSALVLAATNAHYEVAAELLERGAEPNGAAQGWTALHQIAWSRRWNMGFNLPGPAQTGQLDSLELVRQLAARGADLNARQTKEPADGNRNKLDRLGATAFVLAAKSCDLPLMELLLELGADPSLTTNAGTTAVMAAAGVGIWAPGENPGTHAECLAAVTLALDSGGGDVNAIDANGETALHGAVYRGGNISVIQLLADRGAKLDVVNSKGLDARVRRRRRRVHARRAEALSRSRGAAALAARRARLARAAVDATGPLTSRTAEPRHAVRRAAHRAAAQRGLLLRLLRRQLGRRSARVARRSPRPSCPTPSTSSSITC